MKSVFKSALAPGITALSFLCLCVAKTVRAEAGNDNDRNSLLPRFRSSRARYRRGAR
jgi:hypothetical protein